MRHSSVAPTGPLTDFAALAAAAARLPPVRVAVAGAADREVLGGALLAARAGLARALLVGERAKIHALLLELGAAADLPVEIIDAPDESAAAERAVALVREGQADVLLKGMVSTGTLMRAALGREAGLRAEGALLSDVMLCPNPLRAGRPFVALSDGGLNVAPTLAQKQQILVNALDVLRALGHSEPGVAVLCASEKVDRAMPATLDADAIAKQANEGAFGACLVEGPLSFDVALSVEAARHKGVTSRVAGRADLLLVPSVEAGNMCAKALYLVGRLPVAHVIAGARAPILINSRSDSAEDRYRSIVLAMVVAAARREAAEAERGAPHKAKRKGRLAALAPQREVPSQEAPLGDAVDTLVLAINPGATSTKVALFGGSAQRWRHEVLHDDVVCTSSPSVFAQLAPRLENVRRVLAERGVRIGAVRLAAVVGRGGLLPPLPSGTYVVNEALIADLRAAERGEHASNLGAPLAAAVAREFDCPAFIVDPVCVDEMLPAAKLTGWPGLERESLSHALNLRAVARRVARELATPLTALRLIGVHLGSGISMAAFERGRMVDIVNPREEGPISADRAGALPAAKLAKLVVREGWTLADCERRLGREAGLSALVGTRDLREVRSRAAGGDAGCATALAAMALGIAKAALGLLAALEGVPDRFFLTGGMAHDGELVAAIRSALERIADVVVMPGEDELMALAEGAARALRGDEPAREYGVTRVGP